MFASAASVVAWILFGQKRSACRLAGRSADRAGSCKTGDQGSRSDMKSSNATSRDGSCHRQRGPTHPLGGAVWTARSTAYSGPGCSTNPSRLRVGAGPGKAQPSQKITAYARRVDLWLRSARYGGRLRICSPNATATRSPARGRCDPRHLDGGLWLSARSGGKDRGGGRARGIGGPSRLLRNGFAGLFCSVCAAGPFEQALEVSE